MKLRTGLWLLCASCVVIGLGQSSMGQELIFEEKSGLPIGPTSWIFSVGCWLGLVMVVVQGGSTTVND